jgi:hypothetical protein
MTKMSGLFFLLRCAFSKSARGCSVLTLVYAYLNIDNKKLSYIRSIIYWAANCMSILRSVELIVSLLLGYLLESRKQDQQVSDLGQRWGMGWKSKKEISMEKDMKYIKNKQSDDTDIVTTKQTSSHILEPY